MAALDVEGTNVIVPGSTVFATSGGRNSMDGKKKKKKKKNGNYS